MGHYYEHSRILNAVNLGMLIRSSFLTSHRNFGNYRRAVRYIRVLFCLNSGVSAIYIMIVGVSVAARIDTIF